MLEVNVTGLEQTGSWWWLATAAPHAGTSLDLLHSGGVAAAVVGLFLLLGTLAERIKVNFLILLSGPGAMTLSLYSACLGSVRVHQPAVAHGVDGRRDVLGPSTYCGCHWSLFRRSPTPWTTGVGRPLRIKPGQSPACCGGLRAEKLHGIAHGGTGTFAVA